MEAERSPDPPQVNQLAGSFDNQANVLSVPILFALDGD